MLYFTNSSNERPTPNALFVPTGHQIDLVLSFHHRPVHLPNSLRRDPLKRILIEHHADQGQQMVRVHLGQLIGHDEVDLVVIYGEVVVE